MSTMAAEPIGPEKARATLAEASGRQAAVGGGGLGRESLLVVVGWLVGYSLVVVTLRGRVPWFWINSGLLIVLAAFAIWRNLRRRVVGRASRKVAVASTGVSMTVFTILQFVVAPGVGWYGRAPDWHFVAVAAVSALPLLTGAWLVGRGR